MKRIKHRLKRRLNLRMRGFTLIELLVVIAIVGVLGSTIYAPFNESRKKGRDGKRVAEIKAIQSSLLLFSDDNGGCFPDTKAISNRNGYFAKSNNKYISSNLFNKITIGNPRNIVVVNGGSISTYFQPANAWTSKAPYILRSVGDDSQCEDTTINDSLFPNYQLFVELESHSSALDGDTDADMSTILGKINNTRDTKYDGYNISDQITTEPCVSANYKPGVGNTGMVGSGSNGSYQCVYDVSNL